MSSILIALRLILPFPTTYLYETGFSSVLVIKSKYRSRLVAEDDLHCALAKTAPRISDMSRKKQAQPSADAFWFSHFELFCS